MRVSYRSGLVAVIAGLLLSACGAFSGGPSVGDLETQNAQLQATINEMGTPAATLAALEMTADRGIVLQAEANNAAATAVAAQATLTMLQLGGSGMVNQSTPAPGGGGSPADGQVPAGAPTPAGQASNFSNTTTATGRDDLDCPLGETAVFEATEDTIYVIARIADLPAGSTLSARWYANGSMFFDDAQCWVPQQNWVDVCAYCSIVPDGPTFPTGSWMVEMLLDGQLMSQTQFQVIDSTQQGAGATGDGTTGDGTTGEETGDTNG